jgi:hypothetical protein
MSDCAGWTPHSGYHWDGSLRRFFEGWYFRLTLPELGESVAFMYSIDDPAGHSPVSGGAAQVLGLGETYLYHPFPDVDGFWAWRGRLGLGHWGAGSPRLSPPPLIRGAGGIATPSVGPADENCVSSKEASVKIPLPSLGEGLGF